MKTKPYHYQTRRFYAGFEAAPDELAQPIQRGMIYYNGLEFANIWLNNPSTDWLEKAGLWEYNADKVAIKAHYKPIKNLWPTIGDLLAYLEATFPEV